MRISQETISQVKAYKGIVEIISSYITLKKRGRHFVGLCPFHSERTPSFTVSQDKNLFYCFGCQESGDSISFLMKMDHIGFADAVQIIAQKANIPIIEDKQYHHGIVESEKEELFKLQFEAREYFKQALQQYPLALEYLYSRGLTQESIAHFHLGFSPPRVDLSQQLKKMGFSLEIQKKSGLFYLDQMNQLSNRFSNRIIFPILDHLGRTCGFGGRLFQTQSGAKYINSEENDIFNKRRILYGFNLAKKGLSKTPAILVEGYLDVILLHQYGFPQAVATMGTAVSSEQVQRLKNMTPAVYMAMDNDDAGQSAIEKSYDIFRRYQMMVYVVSLQKKDPADFLKSFGKEAFDHLLQEAMPMVTFLFNRSMSKYDVSRLENIEKILSEVLPALQVEADAILLDKYVSDISKLLGINPELLMAKIKKSRYTPSPVISTLYSNTKKSKFVLAEEFLISESVSNLEKRKQLLSVYTENLFFSENAKRLWSYFSNSFQTNQDFLLEVDDHVLKSYLSKLMLETESDASGLAFGECLKTLKSYRLDQRIDDIKKQLVKIEKQEKTREVEEELISLMVELQALKEQKNI